MGEKKFTYFSSHKRSILKAASFWTVSIVIDLIAFYLIFGKIQTAVLITAVGNMTGAVVYYLHERFWNSIYWGKKAHERE